MKDWVKGIASDLRVNRFMKQGTRHTVCKMKIGTVICRDGKGIGELGRDGVEHYHDLLLKSRLKSALGSLKLKSLLLCALRLKTGWGKKILLQINYQKAKWVDTIFNWEGTMKTQHSQTNVVGPTLMVASHWGAHFASAPAHPT